MTSIKEAPDSLDISYLGYFWPTMEADTASFARQCQAYQLNSNRIYAPTIEFHSLSTTWPFHTWPFNMIGPITHPLKDTFES